MLCIKGRDPETYDSGSWDFFEEVLLARFPQHFIKLVSKDLYVFDIN